VGRQDTGARVLISQYARAKGPHRSFKRGVWRSLRNGDFVFGGNWGLSVDQSPQGVLGDQDCSWLLGRRQHKELLSHPDSHFLGGALAPDNLLP
jgi:hypothetical protein